MYDNKLPLIYYTRPSSNKNYKKYIVNVSRDIIIHEYNINDTFNIIN